MLKFVKIYSIVNSRIPAVAKINKGVAECFSFGIFLAAYSNKGRKYS